MVQEKTSGSGGKRGGAAGGKEIRLVVRSAEEAVRRVRETLGPEAQVISVRQVKGAGLQRFLAAPRLEIVARGPVAERLEEEEASPAEPKGTGEEKPVAGGNPGGGKSAVASGGRGSVGAVESDGGTGQDRDGEAGVLNCRKFLERAGLPEVVLARLDGAREWREIGAMDVQAGLPRAVQWLRKYKSGQGAMAIPERAAFVGGPGSGKTTALCKLLARQVFIHGKRPQVLRLEVDKPHLDDGLVLYCDVLGIRCARSVGELDGEEGDGLYVDIPGFSLRETSEQGRIGAALEELGMEERILVLNAAYEEAVMRKFVQAGRALGTHRQILTHVDELESYGKLWEFLLDPDGGVLFFSDGQNVAGDRVEDPFGFLMERTFPR